MGDLPGGIAPTGDREWQALLVELAQWDGRDSQALTPMLNRAGLLLGTCSWRLIPEPSRTALADELRGGDDMDAAAVVRVLPIAVDGQPWAAWHLRYSDDTAAASVTGWATAFSIALGAAVATQRHQSTLTTSQSTDALTELANRTTLLDELQRLTDEGSASVVLAIIDVNSIRRYNDEHGHNAGDVLLVAVGELLREIVGELPRSLAARLGGDEFGFVTGAHPLDDVVTALQRLHARAANDLGVGLSSGVATSRSDDVEPVGQLLRRADGALYLAKRRHSAAPVVDASEAPTPGVDDGGLAAVTSLSSRRRWFRDRDDPLDDEPG